MKYLKILANNNRITSDTFSHKQHKPKISDFSLKFVFSGNQNYQLGRRQLSIHPDSFLIINQGTLYASTIESNIPVNAFAIDFDQYFINDFIHCQKFDDSRLLDNYQNQLIYGYDFKETIYPFKGDMRINITHLKNNLDAGLSDELLINEYLHHCLINYYHIYENEVTQKAENLSSLNYSTRAEVLRRLNLAKEYMLSNYNKNISLEHIAQYSCMSVNHFLRTFKQAYTQSPHQFLTQTRLRRAKMLLKTTNYPIGDVVCLVGFECPSSFIRLFKNAYHTTPLKYRSATR